MIRLRVLTASEKEEIRREKLSTWHKWFAWKPVRLEHDNHEVRWFGWIFRKGMARHDGEGGVWWNWKYAENEFDILKIEKNYNR